MAVIQRESTKSLSLLKQAYGELQKGNLKSASKQLTKVEERGTLLVEEVDYLLQRYEVVQQHYKKRDNTLTQLLNDLHAKERQLRGEKEQTQLKLSQEENKLRQHTQKLDQTKRDLAVAESRRNEAAETKLKATRGAIGGGILTFLLPPVGLAVLAVSGGIAIKSGIDESNAQD